jgi:2-methylisocitrate lyase-like PEP mutase family enzyme
VEVARRQCGLILVRPRVRTGYSAVFLDLRRLVSHEDVEGRSRSDPRLHLCIFLRNKRCRHDTSSFVLLPTTKDSSVLYICGFRQLFIAISQSHPKGALLTKEILIVGANQYLKSPIRYLPMSLKASNAVASTFRKLHKSGDPVVLCNVWDAITANAVATVPGVKAIATASYAIAAAQGLEDNDLNLEQNLASIRPIAQVAAKANLPLTVDLQDGYEDIAVTVTAAINLGAVGCNIEDANNRTRKLRSKEEALQRIKTAVNAAKAAGIPDFCVNARTDVIGHGGSIEDAIDRAKAYLDAGACTAFVWGGGARGLTTAEVGEFVEALNGRISVLMRLAPGKLTASELKHLGVARISVGPALQFKVATAFENAVAEMLRA